MTEPGPSRDISWTRQGLGWDFKDRFSLRKRVEDLGKDLEIVKIRAACTEDQNDEAVTGSV